MSNKKINKHDFCREYARITQQQMASDRNVCRDCHQKVDDAEFCHTYALCDACIKAKRKPSIDDEIYSTYLNLEANPPHVFDGTAVMVYKNGELREIIPERSLRYRELLEARDRELQGL